jgi:hypothetical protein
MDTAGKSAMMRAIEDNADQSEIARLLIDYGPVSVDSLGFFLIVFLIKNIYPT